MIYCVKKLCVLYPTWSKDEEEEARNPELTIYCVQELCSLYPTWSKDEDEEAWNPELMIYCVQELCALYPTWSKDEEEARNQGRTVEGDFIYQEQNFNHI